MSSDNDQKKHKICLTNFSILSVKQRKNSKIVMTRAKSWRQID